MPTSITKTFLWLVMTLMALAISAYAFQMVFMPQSREGLVQGLLAKRPAAALSHFLASAIALTVGAFQLNATLRARFRSTHRWLGRFYVIAVIIGGISGLALATESSGGLAAHLGFAFLAIAWLVTTINAYRHIRQRNVSAHEVWMIRSYAVTLAAITLRIYLPASLNTGISFEFAYPVISWACWVPNLIVAELIIRKHPVIG